MKYKDDVRITDPHVAELMLNETDKSYTRGSDKVIPFRCNNHIEPYYARISKVVSGVRCKYCQGTSTLKGFNDLWTTHPEVAKQLVNPDDGYLYRKRSDTKVLWLCDKHPSHPYTSSITNKVAGKGCSICNGNQVLVGFNDLWTTEPELSQELLNPLDGFRHTRGRSKKVWWRCPENHIWEANIYNRTGKQRNGCKECSGKKSRPEVYLADVELKSEDVVVQKYIKPEGWIRGFFPDIYLPEYNLYIEYDGCLWHSSPEKIEYDCRKTKYLLEEGFKVVRLREIKNKKYPLEPLPINHENLHQIMVKYSGDCKFLSGIWEDIRVWLEK